MAKRRKLQAPSAEDLTKIEDEFRHETINRGMLGAGGSVPPIAQVAADAAAMAEIIPTEQRADNALKAAQAQEFEQAQAEGRLLTDLPLANIDADAMIRDRIDLDEADMTELRLSIAANGLRLPVEVFELEDPKASGARYALVSGYRRYRAVQALLELTGDAKYKTIRTIIRTRSDADAAFVAMVEENEVRSELSHFERGRIAVISTQQGAFVNVEDAVSQLFATASKAKRSKVRSFALIFEELGDMLAYPEQLTEKRGLRLAQALRSGSEAALRQALAHHAPATSEEEWELLEPVIEGAEAKPRDVSRGGRPKSAPRARIGWQGADVLHTSSGVTIRKVQDSEGYLLRFEGTGLDTDLMESLLVEIQALLERP